MKKYFKYLFSGILLITVVLMIIFNVHKNSLINNFEHKAKVIDSTWSDIFENAHERIFLLQSLASLIPNNNITDSLAILIKKYNKHENLYKTECSLEFVKLQFDFNKLYLEIISELKNNTLVEKNSTVNRLRELQIDDKDINNKIDKYNTLTLNYNKYLSMFPNFIIAKNNGYTKKKYFTIKFGTENKDPVLKGKELPEWARNIDTL